MSKTKHTLCTIGILLLSGTCLAQSNVAKNDSTYYKSWVGEWYKIEEDQLSNQPTFVVKRGLYASSFEEYWMDAGGNFSMAWRAWDSRTRQWDFAWMSTDGFFQLWEGKKIDNIWYMVRTFIIDGKEVLSRQAFIPQAENELIRTSEHSRDNGKTWQLRFRETYRKRE